MGLTYQSCSQGIYHQNKPPNNFKTANPVIALAGNPNTGKSTLFNALTGLNQHTGNWPGKTVLRAEGHYSYQGVSFKLIDLPGTYSLLANSVEEQVARDYLCFGQPDATIVVLDATCLERNLNLALQVLEITPQVAVCVNLMDEAKRKKITVNIDLLAQKLGVPVIPTEARDGIGLDQLVTVVADLANGKIKTAPYVIQYNTAIEEAIKQIEPLIKTLVGHKFNTRWLALRLLDQDQSIFDALKRIATDTGHFDPLWRGELLV